ncbi:hypothetical protein Droror1_Dr00020112 [Drosera rotundifolia]
MINGISSPDLGKAMAVREAVEVALTMGLEHVMLESDSEKVIQMLQCKGPDSSNVGRLIEVEDYLDKQLSNDWIDDLGAELPEEHEFKFQYVNFSSAYARIGNDKLRLLLITGRLSNPKLVAISNTIAFVNPEAPVYPRIAQGKSWNEMAVKWTSGYGIDEVVPFVEWDLQGGVMTRSPVGTVSYTSRTVCGVYSLCDISSLSHGPYLGSVVLCSIFL